MLNFGRLGFLFRRMVAPSALSYMALWAITLAALESGGQLKRLLGCAIVPHAPLPLWTCSESLVSTLSGLVINAAFVTIVWSPFFVSAAVARLDVLPLAILTFGTHLAGLASMFVLIVRAARRLGGWMVAASLDPTPPIRHGSTSSPEPSCRPLSSSPPLPRTASSAATTGCSGG